MAIHFNISSKNYDVFFHSVFVKLTQSANKSNLLDENGMVKISKFIRSFMGT